MSKSQPRMSVRSKGSSVKPPWAKCQRLPAITARLWSPEVRQIKWLYSKWLKTIYPSASLKYCKVIYFREQCKHFHAKKSYLTYCWFWNVLTFLFILLKPIPHKISDPRETVWENKVFGRIISCFVFFILLAEYNGIPGLAISGW